MEESKTIERLDRIIRKADLILAEVEKIETKLTASQDPAERSLEARRGVKIENFGKL